MNSEIEISSLVERGENQEEKARGKQGDTARSLYERAVVAYDRAARLAEEHLGKFDKDTLTIRDRLATALRESGNISRAILINKENVNRYQDCQGDQHYLTLEARRRLAECYLKNQKYAEAIDTYNSIVLSRGHVSDLDLYQDRTDLAAALFESGTTANVMEAVDLNIRTLKLVGRKLGDDHIEAIKVRHNLGTELSKLGKNKDAEEYFERNLSLLQDPNCNARVDDTYRKYVRLSEASLARCSKILKREEKREAEQKQLEKERLAEERAEMERLKKEKEERERLDRLEEERIEILEKEKAESERIKREEARKRRRLRQKQKAEQERIEKERIEKERIEKERIETARLEAVRLENERLEEKKLEAERAEKEEVELQAKNERRRKRKEAKLQHDEEQKKKEQTAKQHEDSEQSHSQSSRAANQNEMGRVPHNQKISTKQGERQRRLESSVSEKVEEDAQNDKSTSANKHKERRQEQGGTYLAPVLQLQDVSRNLGQKKTTVASKSKSFEELPVLDRNTTPRNKKSLLSRSRSTSDRPNSTPLSIPDIVLHQQKDSSHCVPGKEKERLDHNRGDGENEETKRPTCETHKLIDDVETRPRKTDLLAGNSNENKGQDVSRRTKKRSHPRSSSPKLREVGGKISNSPPTPTSNSNSELILHGGEAPASTSILLEQDMRKDQDQSTLEPDTRLTVAPQSDENKYRYPDASIPLPVSETPKEELVVRPVVQQDTTDLVDLTQAELDVTSISSFVKRQSLGNATALSQSLMQSLKVISSYTAKAAGTLTSRRSSLPGQLGHGKDPDYPVEAGPSQVSMSGQYIEDLNIKNELESELVTPLYSVHTAQSRTSSVPGSWNQDFDEPTSQQDAAVKISNTEPQDDVKIQDATLQIPDIRFTAPVDTKKLRRRSRDFRQESLFSDSDMQKADDWFEDLKVDVHSLLDRYSDDLFTSRSNRPVKIAILDTGVARNGTKAPALMKSPRIKLGKQLDKSLPWNEDVDGHGTHAAGLIRQVCPYADVYVYRVLESHESLSAKPLSRTLVVEALADAVDKKNVDIISMSLGWKEDNDRQLRDAIDHAKRNNVLLFAASSNDGVRGGMAYPARADEVIAIDAATGHGKSSGFNPPRDTDKTRFTVLGEAVRSTYPKDLESDELGWKRMSGTSCATPIAAGIAGLILEFARQRPLCYDSSIEAHLKTVVGMRQVFKQLLSKPVEGFNHLDPTWLLRCTEEFEDGGEWYKFLAPRTSAATKIVECLQDHFSPKLGLPMRIAVEEENRRAGQAA